MEEKTLNHFYNQLLIIIDSIIQECNLTPQDLYQRLQHNNFRDLKDLSTLWYPFIKSDDRLILVTWNDILEFSNIKYNQAQIRKPSFGITDIENQTLEIKSTLKKYGRWFLPNWIDIFPDLNNHKESILIFNPKSNNARKSKQNLYNLWVEENIVQKYSGVNLFPSYQPNEYFFYDNFPDLDKPYDPFFKLFAMEWISQLKVFHSFRLNKLILVTAGTGVGKSTIIPMILWKALFKNYTAPPQIICTQPRIQPTLKNARRISQQIGFKINEDQDSKNHSFVQYQTSSDKSAITNEDTYLRFETDGVLFQNLTNSQQINEQLIIIDECHEHKTNMDMITTFLKYNSTFRNNSVKVAFVSATMDQDAKRYRSFFWNSMQNQIDPRVNLEEPDKPKTPFKITEICQNNNGGSLENPKPIYNQASIEASKLAIKYKDSKDHNILIIFPGLKEIEKACKTITKLTPLDVICLPLYGDLSELPTNTALSTPADEITRGRNDFEYNLGDKVAKGTYKIKVIIATDIAEASLTINGLSFVIDCGITKKPSYKADRGFDTIESKWISIQSHIQRKGRVGRERPGTFIYLYDKKNLSSIPNYEICSSASFTDTIFRIYTNPKLKFRISSQNLFDASGTYYFIHPNELEHTRISPNNLQNTRVGYFEDPRPSEYVSQTLFYLNKILNSDPRVSNLITQISDALRAIPAFYPDIWQIIALTLSANYNCLDKMARFISISDYSKNNIIFYREQLKLIDTAFLDGRIIKRANNIASNIKNLYIKKIKTERFENCLASSMLQKLVYYQNGSFYPIYGNKFDDKFFIKDSTDAFRKCWFYLAEKTTNGFYLTDTISFDKILPINIEDTIPPITNLTIIDLLKTYFNYRYDVLIPVLEATENKPFPDSYRNKTFKLWVNKNQNLPEVKQFKKLLQKVMEELLYLKPSNSWIKSPYSFQTVMDIFNFATNNVLISAINNKWRVLFTTDKYQFKHYLRLQKKEVKINASIMMIQLKRWDLLFQVRYLNFTTDTLNYLKTDGYQSIISYVKESKNNIEPIMQEWLCKYLNIMDKSQFKKKDLKNLNFCPQVIRYINTQLGGQNELKYYSLNSTKITLNNKVKKYLLNIHQKAFNINSNIYFDTLMNKKKQKILLASNDSFIAGFCLIDEESNYLHDLCVKKQFQKKGVATFILSSAQQNYPDLWLNVEKYKPNTEKLLQFYSKRQFKIFGENLRYFSLRLNNNTTLDL